MEQYNKAMVVVKFISNALIGIFCLFLILGSSFVFYGETGEGFILSGIIGIVILPSFKGIGRRLVGCIYSEEIRRSI